MYHYHIFALLSFYSLLSSPHTPPPLPRAVHSFLSSITPSLLALDSHCLPWLPHIAATCPSLRAVVVMGTEEDVEGGCQVAPSHPSGLSGVHGGAALWEPPVTVRNVARPEWPWCDGREWIWLSILYSYPWMISLDDIPG